MRLRSLRILGILLVFAWLCGCAATGGGHREVQRLIGRGQYEGAIKILLLHTVQNPQDATAHRLLGIAQYHLEDYPSARESLKRALEISPRDAVAHFYAGLEAERTTEIDRALYHYGSFLSIKRKGALAKRARRRMEDLKTWRAEEFAREAIAQERTISPGQFSDSTIGVVYFDARFLSDPLRPLATGLADLMTADLSKVNALRVVERIRLNRILAELRLSHSAAFDTTTAPRLGKLLGAAHVLGGTIAELPGKQMRIDPNLVNTKSGEVFLPDEAVGKFGDIIRLEKAVVLATIDRLGIKLTRAERDSIARIPTESFRAFLMYSRGLELLDQGKLKLAAAEFKRALEFDPEFQPAKDRIELTEILINTPTSGIIDDFESRADADLIIRGPTGATAQVLIAGQDRLGFLPESRRGHDEPYTSPYGGAPTTATVIIEGRFDDDR